MTVHTCSMEGLRLFETARFCDARGWFKESWNARRYQEAGLLEEFVQDNVAYSKRGALRGMHWQYPLAQGKLVHVLHGEAWDVVVDVRRSSPTFRRWEGFPLSAGNGHQVFVPPGFAHGFLALSDEVVLQYKTTARYSPGDEVLLRWDDPEIGIEWPIRNPILSPRDATAPCLREIPAGRIFE